MEQKQADPLTAAPQPAPAAGEPSRRSRRRVTTSSTTNTPERPMPAAHVWVGDGRGGWGVRTWGFGAAG
jgi:hypothetical protein